MSYEKLRTLTWSIPSYVLLEAGIREVQNWLIDFEKKRKKKMSMSPEKSSLTRFSRIFFLHRT